MNSSISIRLRNIDEENKKDILEFVNDVLLLDEVEGAITVENYED